MEVRPGYKQTDVGVIPEDWEAKPIGDLHPFVTSGSRGWAGFYADHGSPFIRITNLTRGSIHLDLNDLRFVSLPADNSEGARTQLQPGDVLISITADIGIVSYVSAQVPRPAYINQHIALVRFDPSITNPKFVSYFLASEKPQKIFRALTDSGAKAGMNLTTVKQVRLALPPTKAEQEAIAEALSDADALVESLEQLLAKKRHLKQGAMQELLTGKKRLPGFSGEWERKRLGTTAILKARIGWQGLTTAEYLDSGDYYLVTGTEFKEGYIDWNNCHYVDESRYKQDKNIQLKEHDVLVTKDGTIGKVALITDLPKPATLNSGVFVIRPIAEAFHPEFFYYLLCSNVFTEFLVQLSAGSTINHLYQKDFVNFVYRTPATIEEQIAIANILFDMDADIAALEAKLAKSGQLKQGMMQELLTGRIRLVRPASEVVHLPVRKKSTSAPTTSHNWQINEAVVISVLAKNFGSRQWPLGRKRYTKLSYLLHRHVEIQPEGYLKKAAGPYNPATRYKGPEGIALNNGYVSVHSRDKFSGFVAGEKIGEAQSYFSKWYGDDVLTWLEQFRCKSNDELELLTTVDMAMEDLRREGKVVDVATVKQVIQDHPEWEAKLDRAIFSEDKISRAIRSCRQLFASEGRD
ncbi:MAG: restriction endonuclease subunit S [Nitrospirota bacterium]